MEWFKTQAGFSALLSLVVIGGIMTAVAYCIYFERKISAWIQDREGPNRVGVPDILGGFRLWGLGQPIADGLKFFLKEDIIPARVDKPLFILAPAVSFIVAIIGFAVIPWGGEMNWFGHVVQVQVANPDIGLLYVLGVGSMGVYGVVLGGWASNNKYSLYGAVRATAQMLSYEIPLGVAILVVVLTCGSVRLDAIVAGQVENRHIWNMFLHPLGFFILWVCQYAETNRTPFDLAEAEQELVGGFHTEYSAMKFALFFLAEYAHMITGAAFMAVLYLGGWSLCWPLNYIPGLSWMLSAENTGFWLGVLPKVGVLSVKIAFFMFVYMWVRWTLPRFRFDQLMRLAWKGLIPMSLGVLIVAIAGLYLGKQNSVAFNFTGNVIVLIVSLLVARVSRTPITGRQGNLPPTGAPVASTAGEGVAFS